MRARFTAARLAALLLVSLAAAACARAVIVGADPATTSAIEVANQSGTTMIVEYSAGAGQPRATLGAVAPGTTERFIITLPEGTVLSVFGRSDTGTHTSGPHSVTLVAGATQHVILR
jgi:hypothetical protein